MAAVLQQVWVHLQEPAPWRNVNVSTFPARGSCLTPSVPLGLQGEVTKLSLEFKQRCWPSAKSATLSRGRIWGYWVDPCCVSLLRENDLFPLSAFWSWSRARVWQEYPHTFLCVVSNVLMACDGGGGKEEPLGRLCKQNIKQDLKSFFHSWRGIKIKSLCLKCIFISAAK